MSRANVAQRRRSVRTIAATVPAANSLPSMAVAAVWVTGPNPVSPNRPPIRSRFRRDPGSLRARSARIYQLARWFVRRPRHRLRVAGALLLVVAAIWADGAVGIF
ncbi:MAG: hypothetical protein B7Z42_00280 [Brevundimonas sp. 12-68-7]|uniref:Uncharacterized protein n=1 Tax=Brevundimonas subvibrioides TaxID=74313 RepID=A0A258FEB6_9CAUL|nr:MAG: hypothetical protein B7Z42_00280 [Brevundimonas sp. 12-68-7]OYX30557.1 MAG: hypothetical protein B7Z01_14295 [Brevundimonas subvibrioides]